VVSTDVVELSLFDQSPHIGLLKVLGLVFVGGSKVSNHATVVTCDDNTTLASGLDIVDAVFGVHAGLFAGVGQDVGVLVFADAANVDDRVLGEDVLETMY
jgi:hypothetical protein